MKLKYKIIVYVACASACMLAGYLLSEYMMPPTEIQIVEKTKTVTEYINRPTTDEECWKCMSNPLDLDGSIKNNILHAWASDGCRKSERDFILKAVAPVRKNIIQIGYSYSIRHVHEVDALYFRRLTQHMAIGGGPGIAILDQRIYDAKINIASQYEF